MPLDITPLVKAVGRLREGLTRHQGEPADEQLRDGLVQRFEYTYELSHRMLKRFMRQTSASPEEMDRMPFQDLIRTANQQGLSLGDWPAWHRYRDLRSQAPESYCRETARQITDAVPAFLAEAEYLCGQLQARLK